MGRQKVWIQSIANQQTSLSVTRLRVLTYFAFYEGLAPLAMDMPPAQRAFVIPPFPVREADIV